MKNAAITAILLLTAALFAAASTAAIDNSRDGKTRILIAYFTWAENTSVSDPDAVDLDAVSSASLLLPGYTGLLAGWIAETTGGDIFKITVSKPYPSDYDAALERAREELAEGIRPQLASNVKNINDYDVVFLGFPTWVGTYPTAIESFLESNDLSGKTVVPFSAYGTSGFGESIKDLMKKLPNSKILRAFGVYRPHVASAKNNINKWIASLPVK